MLRFQALLAVLVALPLFAPAPASASLSPEAGAFFIHTYPPSEYAANEQSWSIVQDFRGLIFVANNDGVLEFDGVSWRKIAVSRKFARTLAIDSRGVIFVGGRGTFGYLAPGRDGDLQFVSLLSQVAEKDRAFNDIWDVLPTAEGVYFSSDDRVFLYTSGGALKTFRPAEKRFGRAFTYHGEFFITSEAGGLLTMRGGDLVPAHINGDQRLLHERPIFANGTVPLIGYNRRLYRFSLSSIDPFPTSADDYFREHDIYAVSQLPSGDIAVGTKSGGLVLLNQKGELERTIHKAEGLPSDWVNSIYSDQQGNVWLTTDSGLARFPRILTHFGEAQGLHGSVRAVMRIGGVLYAGTSLGLFQMHTVPQAEPVFTPVPEVRDGVICIVERSGIAFVGTEHGLFAQTGGRFQQVLPGVIRTVYDIAAAHADSSLFYTAGGDGVLSLRRSPSGWTIVNRKSLGQDFYSVMEAPDGRVWAAALGSIWRIDFSSTVLKSEEFREEHGVPAGYTYLYPFRGHIVFASQRGLTQFSEQQKRFLPDTELGARFSDGELVVSTIREDPRKDIWITGHGYHGILHGPNLEWLGNPLAEAKLDELYWLDFDPDGTCWTAGSSGSLIRYQRPRKATRSEFSTLIRRTILTNEDKSIFGGDGAAPLLKLPHRDNALRFEYAAPFFEDQGAVQYQVRLVGSDSKWSAWTKETQKDYTNLFEGKYTFEVRARSPHGVISKPASYKFTMEAPWYRTWWAYIVYVAGFLYAGWLILRWRLQALEARNKWLEGVVEERTAEVRSERDQNEALLLNILPKPVASELRTTGSVKPTSFDDVTVCFSDFVGFTLSSEKLPPQELISSLNEYFTAFDEIIGRYGLEKLKTIGDAYMFASGLPNASPSHAVDAVLAAMEMVEVVKKLARPEKGVNWSIRLGLYSGPVVAGVVGVRKFAFDIWGNTVNFAARMESAGSANRVNLSETTGKRVFDFIECEPRGPVRIKEGREMEMYFAVRLKSELLAGPLIDGIPEAFRQRYEQAFAKPPKAFPHLNGQEWHLN
jgi:class 3 adenylate cyclase/ligand-binding sensor domain-containing protein